MYSELRRGRKFLDFIRRQVALLESGIIGENFTPETSATSRQMCGHVEAKHALLLVGRREGNSLVQVVDSHFTL